MTSNPLDYINNMKHGVIPIIGSGKTFKSGTLYSLLDACPSFADRPIAFFKFPDVDKLFPYANQYTVEDFDDIEPDSICVIEDANRVLPSRSSFKQSTLQEYIGMISHKDILIMLTIQNSASSDLALFRDQDIVRVYKLMSADAINFERPEWRIDVAFANHFTREKCKLGYDRYYLSYLPKFASFIYLKPPDWYEYKQSHALRNYKMKDKEVQANG